MNKYGAALAMAGLLALGGCETMNAPAGTSSPGTSSPENNYAGYGVVQSIELVKQDSGGGGGATSIGVGGRGGGESPGRKDIAPQRGSLGSGGGGGEGSVYDCDPGARGGHGYIALRPI